MTSQTLLRGILAGVTILSLAFDACAADYYVSASGNDAGLGTSVAEAWHTLHRVNSLRLGPGDRVFLEGGGRFTGPLLFDQDDRGTGSDPIVVTSYGNGRAAIEVDNGVGIYGYNTAGFSLSAIDVIGAGGSNNTADGVLFYTDLPGDVLLPMIAMEDIEVSGFGRNGIAIGGWNGRSGFSDIRITRTVVHDNGLNGMIVFAQESAVNQRVHIDRVLAYANTGLATDTPSGSGIVLGGVSDGSIEWSTAHHNGSSGNGGVGIWAYASSRITIQYNRSFMNRTSGPYDGGGFDLDGGVTNSVMQFNYAHDNDGAGYLLCQYAGASLWSGNIVRHNVSINDGRKNGYAGIHVVNIGSGLEDAKIHDNVVSMEARPDGAGAVTIGSGTRDFLLHDNSIMSMGARMLVVGRGQQNLRILRNHCWPEAGRIDSSEAIHTNQEAHACWLSRP